MRTFSAADWQAARQAWDTSYDEPLWGWVRDLARERGLLYPPADKGSEDPRADNPSQRALLQRSLFAEPELVRFALTHPKVTSWHDVVAVLLEERDGARQAATQAEQRYRDEKAGYASQREAAASLAGIMQVLADSVGTTPPAPVTRTTAVNAYHHQLVIRAQAYHHQHHDGGRFRDCKWQECEGMAWLLEGGVPTDTE